MAGMWTASTGQSGGVAVTSEQKQALNLIEAGHSILILGEAGTGKSVLLKMLAGDGTDMTATTGIASSQLSNAMTIHSFGGIGTGETSFSTVLQNISPSAIKRWKRCKRLVIDELSRLKPYALVLLHKVAQHVRQNNLPMGGIQVVAAADFLQQGATTTTITDGFLEETDDELSTALQANHVFQIPLFRKLFSSRMVRLTLIFRQEERLFQEVLSEVRIGNLSKKTFDILSGLSSVESTRINSIEFATRLYPKKNQVEQFCTLKRQELLGPEVTYEMRNMFGDQEQVDKFTQTRPLQTFKKGEPVVCVANMIIQGKKIHNGDQGRIETLETNSVSVFFHRLGVILKVPFHTFSVLNWEGETIGSRDQIPLISGFALTIHKCQGMALKSVLIDCNGIWEHGQFYTAISRCMSLEHLFIDNFSPACLLIDPEVINWYARCFPPKPENCVTVMLRQKCHQFGCPYTHPKK
eukprot:Lithocolla_globosa_v1_NODE_3505_length_1652_cov_10.362555.p1 type:complete len:467 gc:universal NODE_3505_length_1652_cov_10.362555:1510-110(-)